MQLTRNNFVFQRMANQLICFRRILKKKKIGNSKVEQINFEKHKNSKINIKFIRPSEPDSKINANYGMDEDEK